MKLSKGLALVLCLLVAVFAATMFAQETTGGMQGTVKDPTGAVVPGVQVTVTSTALVGVKTATTDASGYYRFANLAPGSYTVTASIKGFSTLKHDGIVIGVGHLPSVDLVLQVGATEQVVEVSADAVQIDTTTTRTITNVTQQVLSDVPRGRSFQSVIQFAPGARNEPLAGAAGGTGGTSPGSGGNGATYGYSVAGGADSENSYLVEGQETANIIGGYSTTNVPFEFIEEVQIKSSGIEAEHGGSLGGVVNVVMKKGGNATHGELFTYYETSRLDGSSTAYPTYDPFSTANTLTRADAISYLYQPKKDHLTIANVGGTIGGSIVKDRLWYFLGFAPQYTSTGRQVDFGGSDGLQNFNRDTQVYYGQGRLDAALTQKIRVYGSWLTQYTRRSGARMPAADSTQGYTNVSTLSPVTNFTHGIGYSQPNSTYAVHADITITPTLVATTRYGYSFQNYHDFGYPLSGDLYSFDVNGLGAVDVNGDPLPSDLQQGAGYTNLAYSSTYTFKNANKHQQFDQDIAWFKSGWLGTHNFKFGYQLNHLFNDIIQLGNVPEVIMEVGSDSVYSPTSSVGEANCAAQTELYGGCTGLYGYVNVNDYGTYGKASNFNHGLFAQDAWTIGKGLTLNLGIRMDKEYLPSYAGAGISAKPINFSWADKIAPRMGASWDVFRNGKMKMFGNYGVYNDVMKLNLAISSFGGQFWRQCVYTLDPTSYDTEDNPQFNINTIDAAFVNGRACPSGGADVQANWTSGSTPAGLTFIENTDNRGTTGVAPGLKPYRQHESSFGIDYQLAKNITLETQWTRRRLDHAIEDAAIFNAETGSEVFVNANPGEGINSTFNGFSNYLYGADGPQCDSSVCPMYKASRRYDGVEVRLTKALSSNWGGMFSYTYSKLRGNYSGLTSTDESDGGNGGRNAPNNSRAFDEPYFQATAHGTSADGLLGTDRPNTMFGYGYYRMPWGSSKKHTTTLGWTQTAYQGTPQTSFLDVGYASIGQPYFPVYVEGRGKWADLSTDSSGNISLNSVGVKRTPWYTNSDVSIVHEIKVNKNNEHQILGLEMNVTNVFNQRAVTAYYDGINSLANSRALAPNGLRINSTGQYNTYFSPYDWVNDFNNNYYNIGGVIYNRPLIQNSQYGMPLYYQASRSVRFKVRFAF